MIKSEQRNQSLDGLRGLSALAVLVFHSYQAGVKGLLLPALEGRALGQFNRLGPFAVMVFFMISGLLIIQSLIRHGDVAKFLLNRVVRIFPVFLLIHVCIFAVGPLAKAGWLAGLFRSPVTYVAHFLSNLFLLPGVFRVPIAQKNAWSLSFEFAFYLLSSLFFIACDRSGRRNGALRLGSLLLATVASATLLYHHPDAWFFVAGVIVCGWLKPYCAWTRFSRARAANGILLLVVMFFAYGHMRWLSLLAGSLLLTTVAAEEGLLCVLLRTRVFQHLGKVSYSFYLIHPFILAPAWEVFHRMQRAVHNPALLFAVFFLSTLAATTLLATLAQRWIEATALNAYKGRTKRKRTVDLTRPLRPVSPPEMELVGAAA